MLTRFLTALGLCTALTAPAHADFGVGQIVQLEVLDGGVTAHGTQIGALHLTLEDGWKTYWRAPGDAGIPPHFNWQGSRNVGDVQITWPAPEVFDQNGMRSVGYTEQLVLPIEITPARPDRPVRLRGQMEIGICREVCIPGTLKFDHTLSNDTERNPAIAAAMASRPYSAQEAGVRSAVCRLSPTEGGLRLEAHIKMPSAGGTEYTVIEPGNPQVWASEASTSRQGDTLVAASNLVHVDKGAYALDRSQVRITVLGRNHSVDIQGCAPG